MLFNFLLLNFDVYDISMVRIFYNNGYRNIIQLKVDKERVPTYKNFAY